MKHLKVVTFTIGTMYLVGSLAFSADLSQRGPISFDVYDTDKSGFISEKEFNDARAKRMELREKEGTRMRNAKNAPEFSVFDTNRDGKLSKMELLEGQTTQMQKNDRMGMGMGTGMGMGRNR